MVVSIKNIIFNIFFISICLTYENSINVITTNDLHGSIDEQQASFINPSYPPTIIGGSGFLYYVDDLKYNLNNSPLLLLDGGNIFQGHPVGIIDSGYRGNLGGFFDYNPQHGTEKEKPRFPSESYQQYQRLVQICSNSLKPFKVILVDDIASLGSTERGAGGFGSTGI